MRVGFLQEQDGSGSFRRLAAAVLGGAGIVGGISAVFLGSDWKIVAVAFGVPCGFAFLFAVCTTVSEVVALITAARKVTNA